MYPIFSCWGCILIALKLMLMFKCHVVNGFSQKWFISSPSKAKGKEKLVADKKRPIYRVFEVWRDNYDALDIFSLDVIRKGDVVVADMAKVDVNRGAMVCGHDCQLLYVVMCLPIIC